MIYVREKLNYYHQTVKFVYSTRGEVGVGCYLIPLTRNMKRLTRPILLLHISFTD